MYNSMYFVLHPVFRRHAKNRPNKLLNMERELKIEKIKNNRRRDNAGE